MNGLKLAEEDSVSRFNALERGLATIRMVRESSPHIRETLVLKCRDSTWKVNQPTGRTLDSLIRMTDGWGNK